MGLREDRTLLYWDYGSYLVGQVWEVPALISQGDSLDELVENVLVDLPLILQ